eukprot:TRINITY_DN7381_c1_g1_i3.p2 TRINITY_DN7381_c1_g1~~TRINITY_DN7381_c1_g1_i3.p2  ORF type:complete len:419 (-),score=68.71 TRINITY_DN7381_c1_g1_i3:97-1353(-)
MSWQPSGLHVVGVCNFEYDEGFLNISPDSHLVGQIFYPADPIDYINYPTLQWLPNFAYIVAITRFLFVTAGFFVKRVVGRLLANLVNLIRSNFKLRGRCAPPLIRAPTTSNDSDVEIPIGNNYKKLPVIIFSHGLGGNRSSYSFFCSEMASHGYFVLSVEHADTSASMVQLAGKRGRIFFDEYGNTEKINSRIRYRVGEMSTAVRVVKLLNEGLDGDKLKLLQVENKGMFKGRLDVEKIVAAGHSYGGATVTEAMASQQDFKVCVSWDPYFPSLPSDSNALNGWKHSAPLLIIGSVEFNTPNKNGFVSAGKNQQEKILGTAKQKDGAIFCIPTGSIHQNFDDAGAILQDSKFTRNLTKYLGFQFQLEPLLALKIVFDSSRAFIEQRFVEGKNKVSENEVDIYRKILGDKLLKLEIFSE